MSTRSERDFLGEVKIPSQAYYGSTTARSLANYQISGISAPEVFAIALGTVKMAALEANTKLGLISKKTAVAMAKATREFIEGKFKEQFKLDVFQAGAGTSYNMNANEIIANRANEILGGKKGEYKFVHPNNHVNMSQSTNDVIPTATRLAALMLIPDLIKEIKYLEKEIEKKSIKFRKVLKVGRTHLQDAVPITFAQEFDSYKEAIRKSRLFIENQSKELNVIGLGGTAVGTGINTETKYKTLVTKSLSDHSKIKFRSAKNFTEIANNMNVFMNLSASLRSLAVNILNFASDLKLMNSGPKAGFGEISIPEVQAGSSIMPGKVNPSIIESTEMVCLHVQGNDHTVTLACQKSNFELNTTCPLIMHNLLESITILTNSLRGFRQLCVSGISINEKRVRELFENSLCTATALAPGLGYQTVSEIVKYALKNGTTIREEVLKRKLLSEKEIDMMLNAALPNKPQSKK